jgi:hypothetical protein
MNGTHLLRKLTLKSVLKFGIHADLSVIELINLQKHKYLLWVYYHCAQIDFNEEVKEYLCINPEREIEKPGKLLDGGQVRMIGQALFDIIERDKTYKNLDFKQRNFLWMESKAEKNRKIISGSIRGNKERSKMLNKNRNQKS